MGMISEFKDFISRGNVIDLAVGVIIGASFGKIITSLVEQVVMPPIGLLLGKVDFSKLKWVLAPEDPATEAIEEVAIQYGAFINTLIQFAIVAFVIFLMVKFVNRLRREKAAEPDPVPAAPTATEALLAEIRDELRARPRG
ncbi:MAG: large-conductance mechanosensitive channel protein MscL [Alphaproteobacteria bacterium]|uniref:large-conductance mechanosensitive channel protein MscL n=1 Tax=Brevundimonas sp. TaxID=1871086 RepID=UPI0018162C5A|nr:large-conductance mechanosensitive channel protein MscL [Brevundimonas sp.]MBA3048339.1 large-conductance mechanosensitive channel protein MscL [Brevundimonas sp.]MBU3972424.1 large-conductance mechanosensitive channel protein MscL [Alphaproteobacteria bacterium]MBU4041018.1 large-conductance mechanosensitive channel protein MscL [Alphaproteobacteria bacterium]MBU4135687.1 large-conductance mechanosensitive channel protein MscL [Alphaproteobacteria bacterium]